MPAELQIQVCNYVARQSGGIEVPSRNTQLPVPSSATYKTSFWHFHYQRYFKRYSLRLGYVVLKSFIMIGSREDENFTKKRWELVCGPRLKVLLTTLSWLIIRIPPKPTFMICGLRIEGTQIQKGMTVCVTAAQQTPFHDYEIESATAIRRKVFAQLSMTLQALLEFLSHAHDHFSASFCLFVCFWTIGVMVRMVRIGVLKIWPCGRAQSHIRMIKNNLIKVWSWLRTE